MASNRVVEEVTTSQGPNKEFSYNWKIENLNNIVRSLGTVQSPPIPTPGVKTGKLQLFCEMATVNKVSSVYDDSTGAYLPNKPYLLFKVGVKTDLTNLKLTGTAEVSDTSGETLTGNIVTKDERLFVDCGADRTWYFYLCQPFTYYDAHDASRKKISESANIFHVTYDTPEVEILVNLVTPGKIFNLANSGPAYLTTKQGSLLN